MRVHVVDPSAFTPPYDHALCRALAAADTEVELFTSHFAYGPVAAPDGYERHEFFYRAALGAPGGRVRMASKLAQHVPDMLRYRRAARTADVVHFQWLSVQYLDGHLLPGNRPLVLTAHDLLPREPRPGQLAAQRHLYDRFDAIVVHSEHGRARLTGELGVDGERVHVIPHGVFTHLAEASREKVVAPQERRERAKRPSQQRGRAEGSSQQRGRAEGSSQQRGRAEGSSVLRERAEGSSQGRERTERSVRESSPQESDGTRARARAALGLKGEQPVVLMFGLMRPYKGIAVLLSAWRGADGAAPIEDAELLIAGMPRMDITTLRAAAPANVRFDSHFITDGELPAYFQAADLIVLPYLQADQSGVLFTALAFGKPLLLSDVGGFPELASTGAVRIVPAGDAGALGRGLRELLADPPTLAEMCMRARATGEGRYSWETVARAHVELYERLLREAPQR